MRKKWAALGQNSAGHGPRRGDVEEGAVGEVEGGVAGLPLVEGADLGTEDGGLQVRPLPDERNERKGIILPTDANHRPFV